MFCSSYHHHHLLRGILYFIDFISIFQHNSISDDWPHCNSPNYCWMIFSIFSNFIQPEPFPFQHCTDDISLIHVRLTFLITDLKLQCEKFLFLHCMTFLVNGTFPQMKQNRQPYMLILGTLIILTIKSHGRTAPHEQAALINLKHMIYNNSI